MKQLGMFSLVIMAILTAFTISNAVAEVCTDEDMNFTKADNADISLAANQDRITDNVWLTRGNSKGLFNIKVESEFDKSTNTAPAGTEWAAGSLADGDPTAKTYTDWVTWAGGTGSVGSSIADKKGVLHLITDDKYLDIEFLSWTQSAGGGGFSYRRSTCVDAGIDDSDDDGIADDSDNCPNTSNPGQEDSDDNGIGDVCDDDGGGVNPSPDIKVNFLAPQVNLGTADALSVTISMNAGSGTDPVDWWIYIATSSGNLYFTVDSGWQVSATPLPLIAVNELQLPPLTFPETTILSVPNGVGGPFEGSFHFSVDDNNDGVKDDTFTDSVSVAVTLCK